MKIIQTKVMKGPNYWSNYRKNIIIMQLDIEELEYSPTNKIDGFLERLKSTLPSMYSHRCSESHEGGFFLRVKEGTWIGHVIEHIALEIQTLAGMDVGYGRTRTADKKGIYNVIFAYELEKAGLYAGKAAIRIAEALIAGTKYDVQADIEELKKIKSRYGLGPSTGSIVEEADKRGIPFKRLNNGSFVLFGQGVNQKKIRATMTSNTSAMGVESACDKHETKELLRAAYIPVPASVLIDDETELEMALEEVGFPCVIKPVNGNHGRGITTNIGTKEEALTAYAIAREVSGPILIEKFIQGCDFRFLLINYKLVAVAKRTPAFITGDGASTVEQLIMDTNCDPKRGEGHENVLTKIKIDQVTNEILQRKNYSLTTVLEKDEVLYLKDTANISTGGTSADVTEKVHPANVLMAERVARILNLDICGIDVIAHNIDEPITNENGGILEVNACPGFRMHLSPSAGKPLNVAKHVMDMLYPKGAESRIPVIAVTGTNGKTTTTRLTAHIAKQAGNKVGFTTTDGVYIQDQLIMKGDCTGPTSAQLVLHDPTVDYAVLECARGGILRSGLGFNNCDVSIITNISEDHLSLDGIETLRDMTRVKAVVAQSTFEQGYSILNADDDNVYSIAEDLDCNIALFSINPHNSRVKSHCRNGGLAINIENDYIVIHAGQTRIPVERLSDVPLSFNGTATSMIKNILPAVLASYIQNISINNIRTGLQSFIPSPEFTPGRMNIFNFNEFDLMIDYAHNSGGFEEMRSFLQKHPSKHKVGIIAGVGDRRDEDIQNVGKFSAEIFDEIIIRHDNDLRGRTREEITDLIIEGARLVNPEVNVRVISDEKEAILFAIDHSRAGTFITVCTDNVTESINFVKEIQKKNKKTEVEVQKDLLLKAS